MDHFRILNGNNNPVTCGLCGKTEFITDDSRIDLDDCEFIEPPILEQPMEFKMGGTTKIKLIPKYIFYKCAECGWKFETPVLNKPVKKVKITFYPKNKINGSQDQA